MKKLILLAEKDQEHLEFMEFHFSKEGFQTVGLFSIETLLETIQAHSIDLVVLAGISKNPKELENIHLIRHYGIDLPLIYITDIYSKEELFRAFEMGCDDYLAKPVTMRELILRSKSILRRSTKALPEKVLIYKDIMMDIGSYTVTVENRPVELTKLEFELLRILIKNKNTTLTREYLLKEVWGSEENYKTETVNVAITRLKEKIDPEKRKNYIRPLRGVGYSLQ